MRKAFGKLFFTLLACLTLAFGLTACNIEPPVESGLGSSISTEENSDDCSSLEDSSTPENSSSSEDSSNPKDSSSPEDSSSSGEEVHTHSYTTETTAPTCTEQGFTMYTCGCGDSYVDDYIDALQHDEESHGAKEATCTEIGWNAYVTCARCEYTTYQEVGALGHSEQNHGAKEATCTEIGWNNCYKLNSVYFIFVFNFLFHWFILNGSTWFIKEFNFCLNI